MLTLNTTKTLLAFAVIAGAVGQAGAASAAQSTATATFTAGARIITPITLTKATDMNFGDVVPGSSTGTVVLTTGGAVSSTGGVTLGNSTSVSAATFNVGGQGSSTYAITVPPTANIVSGANTMSVSTFVTNPAGTGTLSAGGTQALAAGATLNVLAAQASGSYTGTFTMTVAYN